MRTEVVVNTPNGAEMPEQIIFCGDNYVVIKTHKWVTSFDGVTVTFTDGSTFNVHDPDSNDTTVVLVEDPLRVEF